MGRSWASTAKASSVRICRATALPVTRRSLRRWKATVARCTRSPTRPAISPQGALAVRQEQGGEHRGTERGGIESVVVGQADRPCRPELVGQPPGALDRRVGTCGASPPTMQGGGVSEACPGGSVVASRSRWTALRSPLWVEVPGAWPVPVLGGTEESIASMATALRPVAAAIVPTWRSASWPPRRCVRCSLAWSGSPRTPASTAGVTSRRAA